MRLLIKFASLLTPIIDAILSGKVALFFLLLQKLT